MTAFESIKRICTLASRYPRQIAVLRVGSGIYMLCLMTLLYSTGHGGRWAWLLAVGTAVNWVWAYFLCRFAARRETEPRLCLR